MIDGIIMPNEVVTQHYLDTVGRNYRLPVIAASYGNPARFSRAVPRVEIDMEKVMELAVRELRAYGHKRLALAMPYPFRTMDVRRLAFCSLMEEVYGNRIKDYYICLLYTSNPMFFEIEHIQNACNNGLRNETAIRNSEMQ